MKNFKKTLQSIPNLDGKTYIVTGANSGLGFALCELLVQKGAAVIMLNRSEERTEKAIKSLKGKYPQAEVRALYFEQSDKASITHVVNTLKNDNIPFDGIVLNAGIYMPPKDATNANGIPLTFAVNYYGNYLLVEALANANLLTKERRVIFTTSLVAYNSFSAERFNELTTCKKITRHQQYRGAKSAINVFAVGLMAKHEAIPFKVDARTCLYHPGITRSNIAQTRFPFINGIVQGAMRFLFHGPDKASLGALVALTVNDDLCGKMVVPSWYKEWRGLPKTKKVDTNLLTYVPLLMEKTSTLSLT